MAQFLELRKEYQGLNKDLHIDYNTLPQTLHDGDDITFLIIGAGHAGLLAAVRLIDAGFSANDMVIVDKAGDFGGTWYWNRFPGPTCDIEGYIYLPLLEELGYMPKHRYSNGHEIREHSQKIAQKWKLKGQFGTTVMSQEWSEEEARWRVSMVQDRDQSQLQVRAQFVFCAPGVFPTPHIPRLAGLDDFRRERHVLHTARWDYAFTGGSQETPTLQNLRDKTVGIIGTGATSIQAVPWLAKYSKHLYVFQRTPSYVGPRKQELTDRETWAKVTERPGWQKTRQENYNAIMAGEPAEEDLVNDGWTATRAFAGVTGSTVKGIITEKQIPSHVEDLNRLDMDRTNYVRGHIEMQVEDKATAERLKPWYSSWCKRPTFHDDYLVSFNRPNVTLINTDGKGVERITEDGIVANGGQDYALDVLIFSTGYACDGGSPADRADMRVIGRNGKSLQKKWNSGDFGTLHGVASHGFPNYFFFTMANTVATSNQTYALDVGATHCAHIIAEAMRRTSNDKKTVVEVSRDAEEAWGSEVATRAGWFAGLATCTPSFISQEGNAFRKTPEQGLRAARMAAWGKGASSYQKRLQHYRADGRLEGISSREVEDDTTGTPASVRVYWLSLVYASLDD
ncbi:putative monooxygenase [Pyrenochaeta sp. MPI-SDFR-AT-0127]|nr:putative monooxygenase [Pyrenochaeta sp. MPI-SDFR-AT-0127]